MNRPGPSVVVRVRRRRDVHLLVVELRHLDAVGAGQVRILLARAMPEAVGAVADLAPSRSYSAKNSLARRFPPGMATALVDCSALVRE